MSIPCICLYDFKSYFMFCGNIFLACSVCIYFMLSMNLVPVESIDVVSDVIDVSSAVEAVFMDSWHGFMPGHSESG
jgi:hypothetical protein